MNQLNLFEPGEGENSSEHLSLEEAKHRVYVMAAINSSSRPLSFAEIVEQSGLEKKVVYSVLQALHSEGKIGWKSRSTDVPKVGLPIELEPPLDIDFLVDRRPPDQVDRPLKLKYIKKGGSICKYLTLYRGNERLCYCGGRQGSPIAERNYKIISIGLLDGKFNHCETKSDFRITVKRLIATWTQDLKS